MSCKKSSKQLKSKEKSKIAGVLSYFKDTSAKSNGSCIQQTVDATGVSRSTVYRIQKELQDTGTLLSPERRERGAYKPVDGFDQIVIRNKVREFYTHRHQLPTLKILHSVLKTEIHYPGSRELLRTTLKSMGFRWKKTTDNRKILCERPAVLSLRLKFYDNKRELEENGYRLVFVDETWIDTSYTMKRCWQGPGVSGVCPPCNRGQRLIVLHAGSRQGFVPGAKLVYKASSSTGDYHKEMDGRQFSKWLQEMLLPNLTGRCAIILDNASYHSVQTDRCPTASTRKDDIKTWLQKQGITFGASMLKTALLDLVKLHKPAPSYAIDDIIRRHGHEVLRLPPYHPEFNAIELIWSQLKQIVRKRNVSFRLDETMRITNEAFDEIDQSRWDSACEHVEKVIKQTQATDHYTGAHTEKIIIHISGNSSDSDDDSSTDTADSSTDTANSSTDTASESELFL